MGKESWKTEEPAIKLFFSASTSFSWYDMMCKNELQEGLYAPELQVG